jgi:aconitate hydratase
VTTSIFPSDEVTRRFLKAQGRDHVWVELSADRGAQYDRVIEVNLSDIEPLVATPHSPGNVAKLKELEGLPVDQVCIGSCTSSSYRDMMTAAAVLRGREISPGVSLGIAPGSRQVLKMLAREGALHDLVESGARILESACGFCLGLQFSPGSGGVSVRTSNRNFEGRSGTKDARVFLCSPEVAAAAAATGRLASPECLGMAFPRIQEPEAYDVDESMFIFPNPAMRERQILRGPGIGDPPRSEPMCPGLSGRVMIKLGDNITTDHILPAGERLKYRPNVPKSSEFVFENIDPTFAGRCLDNKGKGIHNIIVAGESYGQGSSREHAAMCPMYLGVKAIIAKSFERIHCSNLINFGILPLVLRDPQDLDGLMPGDGLSAANWRQAVKEGAPILIRSERTRKTIGCTCELSITQRAIVAAGGLLNHLTST